MLQRDCKLSLFTDDIRLTLTIPHISLPSLHTLLLRFSTLSGYKINTSKTEALPLHTLSTELNLLQHFPFPFPYYW